MNYETAGLVQAYEAVRKEAERPGVGEVSIAALPPDVRKVFDLPALL